MSSDGTFGLRLSRRQLIRLAGMGGAASVAALLSTACSPSAPAPAPTQPQGGAAPAPAPAKQAAPATAAPKVESKPAEAAKAPAKPEASGPAKRGGTLRVVIQNDFFTMWPVQTTGPVPRAVYESLVAWRMGPDGIWGPQPQLAESWELSDKAAVFKLRRGVKFHDGSDLNAEVVRWNVEMAMKHPKSVYKQELDAVVPDRPADVVDDYTVRVNLKGAAGSILALLSDGQQNSGIASKAAHENNGDEWLAANPVGTGPFIFEKWERGNQLVVNRFDGYWGMGADGKALPYLDKVIYRFIPDDSVRTLEMQAGNADFTELIRASDVLRLKADPRLTVVDVPWMSNRYRLVFNATRAPFKDNLKLRQAVLHSIDREAIARALGAGVGVPLKYDVEPGQVGYDESVPYYWYDPDKAKQLVKESGYDPNQEISLTVISREVDQQQAQMLQQMMGAVGIKVKPEILERIAWSTKVREGNDFEFGTQRTGTSIDPDAGLSLAWASEGRAVYHRAKIPEMDQCLVEARSSYEPKTRHETYKRCQTIMHDTAWWGFIWKQPWNYVHNKRVKGFTSAWEMEYQEENLWLDG
jgi:peptide/nickel transport system substrate-binding protein